MGHYRDGQCTGPGGVLFASCTTSLVIRRQIAAPSSSPAAASSSARAALFFKRLIGVTLEDELRRPPNVDLAIISAEAARLPSITVKDRSRLRLQVVGA